MFLVGVRCAIEGRLTRRQRVFTCLDEFPGFGTRVLEVMRQPMKDKVVTICRAKGSLTSLPIFNWSLPRIPALVEIIWIHKEPVRVPLLSLPNTKKEYQAIKHQSNRCSNIIAVLFLIPC